DGKMVASAAEHNDIGVWDAESGKQLRNLVGHSDYVNSVTFSPNGKRVLATSSDATARIWDIEHDSASTWPAAFILNPQLTLKGQFNGAVFSPDGRQVVTSSGDHNIRIWSADNKVIATLKGRGSDALSVEFSSDGKRVATAANDNMA